jgi:hypothetical protein
MPAFAGDAINPNLSKAKANERLRKYAAGIIRGETEEASYCKAYGYDINEVDLSKVKAMCDRVNKLAYVRDQIHQAAAMVDSATLEKHGISAGEILKKLKNTALHAEKDSDSTAAAKVLLSAIGADAPKQNQSTHLTINVVKFGDTNLVNGGSSPLPQRGERYSTLQIHSQAVSEAIVGRAGAGENENPPSKSPS